MSENAFYPVFLLTAWVLMRALDDPTLLRQLVLVGACGVLTLVRVQGIAVVVAALTRAASPAPRRPQAAAALGAALRRRLRRRPARRPRPAGARRVVASLFGAYRVVGEESYDVVEVLRYVFWHLAELDLYVAVIPFAAFLLLSARIRTLDPPRAGIRRGDDRADGVDGDRRRRLRLPLRRRHRGAKRVRRRAAAADRAARLDRPRRAATARVCRTSRPASRRSLPALIPYERFLQLKVRSDTLMIVPLWNVQDEVGLPRLDEVVLLGGIAAAALFLLVPRRYALALPAAVLVVCGVARPADLRRPARDGAGGRRCPLRGDPRAAP